MQYSGGGGGLPRWSPSNGGQSLGQPRNPFPPEPRGATRCCTRRGVAEPFSKIGNGEKTAALVMACDEYHGGQVATPAGAVEPKAHLGVGGLRGGGGVWNPPLPLLVPSC